MAKKDDLDRSQAAAYAWRRFAPDEPVDLPRGEGEEKAASGTTTTDKIAGGADRAAEILRAERVRMAAALADDVERAESLTEDEQAAVISELAQRTSDLDLVGAAMERYPRQITALFRMALRHWAWLVPEARDATRRSMFYCDPARADVVAMFAEATLVDDVDLHGSITMAFAIGPNVESALANGPGARERFARLLDEAEAASSRRTAIFLIGAVGGRGAVEPLRRALRWPHYNLRWRALECLEQRFRDAIEPGDVTFLLEEAVAHAPPWLPGDEENGRAHCYYPRLLARLVARLRPPGAAPLLGRIVPGECDTLPGGRPSLDATWALCAMASSYPDEALPRIDARLSSVAPKQRMLAVEALAELPEELAWPRLLSAAADPVPAVAERAQAIWLSRRGALCRFDELSGLELALLDGQPSERMRSRLAVLRRGPLDARAAMAEVMLGEAPDPEALVLLLFAMGDRDLWEEKPRKGLPENREAFMRAVMDRFGARGALGLVALVERWADDEWDGFLRAFAHLLDRAQVALPDAARAALCELAVRRLSPSMPHVVYAALTVLANLGARPELAPRLAALAWAGDVPSYVAHQAREALAAAPAGDAAVDALIVDALHAALAASDLPRFARVVRPALQRRIPMAIALVEALIEHHALEPQDDPVLTEALSTCADALSRIDRLPASCTAAALASPGTHAFAIAARQLSVLMTRAERRALRAALRGHPAAAAEAAHALLGAWAIPSRDRRLRAIAQCAPDLLRARLLGMLGFRGRVPRELWPMVLDLAVSSDPMMTEPLRGLGRAGLGAELCAIEERIVDPRLREELAEWRFCHRKPAPYWEDAYEDPPAEGEGDDAEEEEEGDDVEEEEGTG